MKYQSTREQIHSAAEKIEKLQAEMSALQTDLRTAKKLHRGFETSKKKQDADYMEKLQQYRQAHLRETADKLKSLARIFDHTVPYTAMDVQLLAFGFVSVELNVDAIASAIEATDLKFTPMISMQQSPSKTPMSFSVIFMTQTNCENIGVQLHKLTPAFMHGAFRELVDAMRVTRAPSNCGSEVFHTSIDKICFSLSPRHIGSVVTVIAPTRGDGTLLLDVLPSPTGLHETSPAREAPSLGVVRVPLRVGQAIMLTGDCKHRVFGTEGGDMEFVRVFTQHNGFMVDTSAGIGPGSITGNADAIKLLRSPALMWPPGSASPVFDTSGDFLREAAELEALESSFDAMLASVDVGSEPVDEESVSTFLAIVDDAETLATP